jgi:hypothetical protein
MSAVVCAAVGAKGFVCHLPKGHVGQHEGRSAYGATAEWSDDAVGAVLPSGTDETPPEPPEAASGAEDAPRTAENVVAGEEIEQTAPVFPAELRIVQMMSWVQRTPGGGRELKIAAAIAGPQGMAPLQPAYVFEFDADAWTDFQALIDRDGEPKPQIVRATHLPPGVVI